MRPFLSALLWALALLLPQSCITADDWEPTPRNDFEVLWRTIDEHYCFFDYKREQYGLDWQEVYRRYQPQVNDSLSRRQLFQILGNMLSELRDGHVNLWAGFDVARYADWYENYPTNFSDTLSRITLGRISDHQVAGPLRYRMLRDNVGYIRCPSFNNDVSPSHLHEALRYLSTARALIVDVRSNGGGLLTAAESFAAAFCNQPTLVGYMTHKRGPAHNDFSAPQPITIEPSQSLRWQKPVAVLTNRSTYSAANAFTMFMLQMPHVITVGDRTGGGSGMPFSSELPSGWAVRFSASPMYTVAMQHTEFGIDPTVKVDITPSDFQRGVDTIIETAIERLIRP